MTQKETFIFHWYAQGTDRPFQTASCEFDATWDELCARLQEDDNEMAWYWFAGSADPEIIVSDNDTFAKMKGEVGRRGGDMIVCMRPFERDGEEDM